MFLSPRLGEISLGVLDVGLGFGDGGEEVGIVESRQNIAFLDDTSLLHQQLGDDSLNPRRHHRLLPRHQVSRSCKYRSSSAGAGAALNAGLYRLHLDGVERSKGEP